MKNEINGSKLAGIIAERGYNYSTLAEEAGIDRNTIASVVDGKYKPSYRVMNALYYTLDLTSEEASEIFFAKNLRNTKENNED